MKDITTEAAKLKAIETIVERHATETDKIMSSNEPTKLLRLALEDANTARALHAIDPEGLKAALVVVEAEDATTSEDAENLIATLKSLVDLGEIDAVVRALKNVTLGSIMKNTGVTTHAEAQVANKITVGGNRSPVGFNGVAVKRKPSKSFNKVVNAQDREFNKLVADHVNINATAKAVLREAMARNTTKAAATINIPANRQPNQEKNAVTKFDDENSWTSYAKQQASIQVQKDVASANKPLDTTIRTLKSGDIDTKSAMAEWNATKPTPVTPAQLTIARNAFKGPDKVNVPFDLRGVNPSDVTRLTQGVVDVVNPNGSAHGPINFNTDGTGAPIDYNQGKDTLPQYRNGKANNGEPQQFPHKVRKDNIEAGPNIS